MGSDPSATEIPAPYRGYAGIVLDAWVDYNGHLNDACYGIVLSEANERLLGWLGLSADYRAATGCGLYTVETHLRYLAECSRGQALTAASTVLAADAKRLRVFTEVYVDGETLAATGDSMYVHVDGGTGRVVEMPADRSGLLEQVANAHAELPRPAYLGRGVGAR